MLYYYYYQHNRTITVMHALTAVSCEFTVNLASINATRMWLACSAQLGSRPRATVPTAAVSSSDTLTQKTHR